MVGAVILGASSVSAQDFSRWSSFCEAESRTAGLALGDLDRDGDLDLVVANGRHFAEHDWSYLNDGHGTFYSRRQLESAADKSYGVALGDLDGDGFLDAVVANDVGYRSIVYRNDGSGALRQVAGLGTSTLVEGRRAVSLADFDGDGDQDVVLVGTGQDHLFLNDRAGDRWTARPVGDPDSRSLAVAVVDFDQDSDPDLLIGDRSSGAVRLLQNEGGRFDQVQVLGEGRVDPTGMAVVDVDRDGLDDVVVVSGRGRHAVFLGVGVLGFGEAAPFGEQAPGAWSVAVGDLDLDGDPDVLVGASDVQEWGDDFDLDGVPDRFGQTGRDAPSQVFLNSGDGQLEPDVGIGFGLATRPIVLADVDGDGDLDAVVGNDCEPNRVYFNRPRPGN